MINEDYGTNYTKNKNLFETVQTRQKEKGNIVNAWLISLILNDETQTLTESDKKALKRILHRIEKENNKRVI